MTFTKKIFAFTFNESDKPCLREALRQAGQKGFQIRTQGEALWIKRGRYFSPERAQ